MSDCIYCHGEEIVEVTHILGRDGSQVELTQLMAVPCPCTYRDEDEDEEEEA